MREQVGEVLRGAYDLHIHPAPDVIERKLDDEEMARRALKTGMKGFAVKSHYLPTAERAARLNSRFPGLDAVGTLTLNTAVGGLNPMAVEASARMGARIVWFPTMDAVPSLGYMMKNLPHHVDMQVRLSGRGIPVHPVSLLDVNGKLCEAAHHVLEVAAAHKIAVGTGHISHEEAYAVVRAAKEHGVDRIILTHADWEFTSYTAEEQKEFVRMGAYIEHSFTSPDEGHVPWEEVFAQIRATGPGGVILSTDLGKTTNVYPDEGLAYFVRRALDAGFTVKELRRMLVENTTHLVGG